MKKHIVFQIIFFITLVIALFALSFYGLKHFLGHIAFIYIFIAFILSFWRCRQDQQRMKAIVEFYELSQYIDDLRLLQLDKPYSPMLKAVTGLGKFDWALLFLMNNESNQFEVVDSEGIDASKFQDICFDDIADKGESDAVLTLNLLKRIFNSASVDEALAGSAIYYNSIYFGCLLVGRHGNKQEMSEHDHFRLKVLSDQISICMHNHMMHNKLAQKADLLSTRQEQIQRELKLARVVQDGVVYKKPEKFDGLTVNSFLIPARFIGGDFLKFEASSNESEVAVLIGDVCGKGIPAALVMAVVVSMFQGKYEKNIPPGELMSEVNLSLKEFLGAGSRFNSTAFLGVFNRGNLEFHYASAGHDFPLHYSAKTGQITELQSTGTLLGIFNESEYLSKTIRLGIGDKILFYTDGLTDFMESEFNVDDGFEYLLEYFKSKVENSATVAELQNMIEKSRPNQTDDITVALVTIN